MNPSDVQIIFADLQPEIVARSKTTPSGDDRGERRRPG